MIFSPKSANLLTAYGLQRGTRCHMKIKGKRPSPELSKSRDKRYLHGSKNIWVVEVIVSSGGGRNMNYLLRTGTVMGWTPLFWYIPELSYLSLQRVVRFL